MSEENQLAVRTPMPFDQMEKYAQAAAQSGMFGITKKEQALCLFAICQSEGLDPIMALKRYHIVDGKPSMRADAMAADFIKAGGAILWHLRNDDICAATFFSSKEKLNDAARTRAISRFEVLWKLDSTESAAEAGPLMIEASKLSVEGEETIIRTYDDAEAKGLTKSWKKDEKTNEWKEKTKVNWEQSPRQMLTARVITEGVRLVAPGLIAGVYSPEEVHDFVQNEIREREEFVQSALSAEPGKILTARDRKSIEGMIDTYLEEAKTASPKRKSELLGLAAELRTKLSDMDLENDEIPGIAPAAASELPVASEPELSLVGEPPPKPVPWREYVLQYVKSKTLRGKKLGSFTADDIRVIAEKSLGGLDSEDEKIRIEANYIKEADDELNGKDKK